MSASKNIDLKRDFLRQVSVRVYRLETQSGMFVFSI